ncbi:Hypothetical predicted protein [Octopus vulgaris]|uniref:Uncharacterized protein n=1 Tax=Octopus vulgaris TaxID=6645 RepID=A0AA36AVX2_OCTVU|nr:Hypothetical predicted protein [Octopus vulgaris]
MKFPELACDSDCTSVSDRAATLLTSSDIGDLTARTFVECSFVIDKSKKAQYLCKLKEYKRIKTSTYMLLYHSYSLADSEYAVIHYLSRILIQRERLLIVIAIHIRLNSNLQH